MKMGPKEAWGYAAQWGSMMTGGDPGACMYGFSEDFHVQTEAHRADCLEWVEGCVADVNANPAHFDADELDKLAALAEALRLAPCDGAEPTIDEFTTGYIDALFWVPGDDLGDGTDARDLAPSALADIVAECAAFQTDNAALLALAYATGYSEARAGHDFWLTRNGHGAGYWDREELEPQSDEYDRLSEIMVANRHDNAAWGDALAKRKVLEADSIGQRLTKAAHAAGEVDAYLGDDGKVYT